MTSSFTPRTPVRELWQYSAGSRGRIGLAAVLAAAAGAAALAQPLVMNRLVTTAEDGIRALSPLVASFTGLVVLGAVLSGLQQRVLGDVAEAIVASVRRRLAARVYDLPVPDYARFPAGDLVARFLTDSVLIRTCVTSGVVDLLGSAVIIIGATIALLVIDAPTFAISVGVALGALAIPLLASSRYRRINIELQERLAQISDHVSVSISAVRLLKAYGATARYTRDLDDLVGQAARTGITANHLSALVQPASSALLQGALVVSIGMGGVRVANGDLTVADLVTFLMFLSMLMAPIGRVGSTILEIQQALAGHHRIAAVVDREPEGGATRSPSDPSPEHGAPDIEFHDVTFAYPTGAVALDAVTFRIAAGTRTAIVGRSGAGKTTVCSLLERYCSPQSGRILIGGTDITTMSRAALRRRIGYVDQAATAFRSSVRANLDPAGDGYSDDQLWSALRAVDLEGLVVRSPAGLDSTVGEQGASLSGGERQRLAIARALVRRPDVLLLDEPTSAADGRTERSLTDMLRSLAGTCTTIVVAHRLSTVIDADRIIVLDEGRVVAVGQHDDLLATSEHYRSITAVQLLGG